MIPKGSAAAYVIERRRQPTETYRLDLEQNRIAGLTDGLEALRQAVYFMLSVERFRHVIYSWRYGIELEDLFGRPMPYVLPEIKRRVREALLIDDRVTDVDEFDFTVGAGISGGKGAVHARFTVRSIYGAMDADLEVRV